GGCDAGDQHHRTVQRCWIAERRERSEDGVAADHRDVHVLAPGEPHHQRDHASVRKIGTLERFIDLDQYHLMGEVDDLQMRPDQLEIVFGQRRQESIGWTRSHVCLPEGSGGGGWLPRRIYVRYPAYGLN